jgi:PAS domain S-box-containing protein
MKDAGKQAVSMAGVEGLPINPEDFSRATMNILEDFYLEKELMSDAQRATTNILEDFDIEKNKVEVGNRALLEEIKERRRIEEQMAGNLKALAEFKDALDAHCIVAITDARGKFTYANDKFCAISKYPREELIGQDYGLVNSEYHSKAFMGYLWQTISSGKVWQNLKKNRAKDGSFYWVDTTIVPFLGGVGNPIQYITICSDVTATQQAQETLRRALQELSKANVKLDKSARLKDEFLANMSHELRTPLNAILGLSESLLEQVHTSLSPRQYKSITTISNSGAHLLSLINDILDLSKIEAGMLELNLQAVQLREFCEGCLVFVRTQALKKKLQVEFQMTQASRSVLVDPMRLKQILVNLLTNAVKFTPEGKRIGLIVKISEEDSSVEFHVWDKGIGISMEDADKLFKSFSQVDSGLDRAQEGTGLGLALVAKLTDLHGGNVKMESEESNGSRFIVTLPLRLTVEPNPPMEGTASEFSKAQIRDSFPAGTLRILLAEDNEANIETIGGYLSDHGFEMSYAMNGIAAVELAAELQPDLILMDIQMPVMDGITAVKHIRNNVALQTIPIIALTALAMPGDRERCIASGATEYLSKPVVLKSLLALIGQLIIPNP